MTHRRSIRLRDYDYTQEGVYFVTLLAYRRSFLFGDVVNGEIDLSTLGCVVHDCWLNIPDHFSGVELDAFVVMPNHLHGIIVINHWARNDAQAKAPPVRATHVSFASG